MFTCSEECSKKRITCAGMWVHGKAKIQGLWKQDGEAWMCKKRWKKQEKQEFWCKRVAFDTTLIQGNSQSRYTKFGVLSKWISIPGFDTEDVFWYHFNIRSKIRYPIRDTLKSNEFSIHLNTFRYHKRGIEIFYIGCELLEFHLRISPFNSFTYFWTF